MGAGLQCEHLNTNLKPPEEMHVSAWQLLHQLGCKVEKKYFT